MCCSCAAAAYTILVTESEPAAVGDDRQVGEAKDLKGWREGAMGEMMEEPSVIAVQGGELFPDAVCQERGRCVEQDRWQRSDVG